MPFARQTWGTSLLGTLVGLVCVDLPNERTPTLTQKPNPNTTPSPHPKPEPPAPALFAAPTLKPTPTLKPAQVCTDVPQLMVFRLLQQPHGHLRLSRPPR